MREDVEEAVFSGGKPMRVSVHRVILVSSIIRIVTLSGGIVSSFMYILCVQHSKL